MWEEPYGGAKAAVREVLAKLPENKFVFRTDVKSYYASIHHDILFSHLQQHIEDGRLLALLWQYMRRTVYDDGLYEDLEQGISLGCPLLPLMGALFLNLLDRRMEDIGVFYVRFMDDWVILAPTRWKLRKAIRIVNQTLAEQQVQQHSDKTFIGRVNRGFSFLGYEFNATGLTGVALQTRTRFIERVNQLYERGATVSRIGEYVRRWIVWLRSGLDDAVAPWVAVAIAGSHDGTDKVLRLSLFDQLLFSELLQRKDAASSCRQQT